jgi:outer membrane receptor protein involved in Fe transport
VAGSISAARYKLWGAAAESKLPTGTYFGIDWNLMKQEGDSVIGKFDDFLDLPPPSARGGPGIREILDYEERAITATVNQLVGDRWSFSAAYRVTWSELQGAFPAFQQIPNASVRHVDSELNQLDLGVHWNHESGFFARADALWTSQENDGFVPEEPGDSFWQLNALAGYRFPRNYGEISVGVLNLLDTDYQLEPLSPYLELPHERTLFVRCRVTF